MLEQRITNLIESRHTPTPASESESEDDGDLTFQIGESFQAGDWEITVTRYEISPTLDSDYEQNAARGVFVIVYLTVTNLANEPSLFPYSHLRLTSSDGRLYQPDEDALFNLTYEILDVGASNLYKLQPRLPYETGVIFDIPPTATGLSLTTSEESFFVPLD